MNYTIKILGDPASSQSPDTALRFCYALTEAKHSIDLVFFYHVGAHTANSFAVPTANASAIVHAWSEFAHATQTRLGVCIQSALHCGVLDNHNAKQYQTTAANLAAGFAISGLGEFTESLLKTDRFIVFGD